MAQTFYHTDFLKKYPEFEELVHIIRFEIQQAQRPSSEVILNDEDVMRMLSISKRKLQYLKSKRILPYSLIGAQSYYLLSDILELIKRNRLESIFEQIRIK